MHSIKKLLQIRLFYYIIAIFVSVLVIFNISIFILSNVQFNNETKRQYESLTNMVAHLSTQEDETVLEAYLEHYVHTNQVLIVVINDQGVAIFDNDTRNELNIFSDIYYKDQYVGKISANFENSTLSKEYSIGFIIFNISSILLFTLGSYILYKYVKKQNSLLYNDFKNTMSSTHLFNFKETETLNNNLLKLMDQKSKQQHIYIDYVKSLAHDIKTPLTVLSMYLEAFKNKKIDYEDNINDEMMSELKKIDALVPKFIEFNMTQISYKQDISEAIRKFVRQYKDVFLIKNIDIVTQLEPVIVDISDDDFSRIIEHLVYNAFYYSNPNHTIRICTTSENRSLVIEDQGIGMSEATINKIMEGPHRSEEAKKFHSKGSGIGYQIILKIIKKLNSQLLIESTIDQGTKVTILFNNDK